jgi:hypothetical protein
MKLTMSFIYHGFIQEKKAFSLQDVSVTLFLSKPKIHRAPKKALSMEVNTAYQNSLLNKASKQPVGFPAQMNKNSFGMMQNVKGPPKGLKISSTSYQPMKVESSNSLTTFQNPPATKFDKETHQSKQFILS